MTELGLNVDLSHPVTRVWRALTDQRLLGEWFVPTDLAPVVGQRFQAHPPAGLAGFGEAFDVEVLEIEEPTLLRQRWRAKEWQAEVTWQLAETDSGCRLRMTQTGFYGLRGERRRRDLRRTYQHLFGERLPALLDRVASGSVDLGGATVDLHTAMSRQRPSASPAEAGPRRRGLFGLWLPNERRMRLLSLVGAMTLMVLVGTAAAVYFADDGEDPMVPADRTYPVGSGVQPATSPTPHLSGSATPSPSAGVIVPNGASPAAPSVTPSHSPLPETTQSPVPGAPLAGYYRTVSLLGLGGFDTEVTVHNPSTEPRTGWKVVLTMPSDKAVENRSPDLVVMTQDGPVVTLVPTEAAKQVGAATSVTFVIRSSALLALGQQAKSCTLDGMDCTKV